MQDQNTDLINLFKQAVGTDKCAVKIEGTTEKGDGYMGDIIFAKVFLDEPNQNGSEIHLVSKISKSVPKIQDFISDSFTREIDFYTEIMPIFDHFQRSQNIKDPFNALAKCYKTIKNQNQEIIVLENMRIKGYELHPRQVPFNINHTKLLLKTYAKFHAVSFALKDQRKDIFNKISDLYISFPIAEKLDKFRDFLEYGSVRTIQNLINAGRKDLSDKFKNVQKAGIINTVRDILMDLPEEIVVTHGDSHNNNFLFQYKNGGKDLPSNVVLLDFQMSALRSPMLDLGYFLYTTSSKAVLSKFTEIMEFYYKELSYSLAELGTDINRVYPITIMWEHWKKYSFFGFTIACNLLEIFYADNPPNTENFTQNVEKLFGEINETKTKAYLERLVFITEHYFNFNEHF